MKGNIVMDQYQAIYSDKHNNVKATRIIIAQDNEIAMNKAFRFPEAYIDNECMQITIIPLPSAYEYVDTYVK